MSFKKGERVTSLKISRRFWRRASSELVQLGYIGDMKKKGKIKSFKVLRNIPEREEVKAEADKKLYTESLESRFNSGQGEIESLMEEINDWKGGMEGTGLENTGKFETLEEASSYLETINDELECIEVAELPIEIRERKIMVSRIGRKRSSSRYDRASEAAENLEAIAGELDIVIDELSKKRGEIDTEKKGDEFDKLEELISRIEECTSTIQEQVDEIQNVEFPGMF